VKEPVPVVQGATNVTGKGDVQFKKLYPNLWEAMFVKVTSQGQERQTHTIFVCEDGGVFKGLLKARQAGLQAWYTADTFTGLLSLFEKGCDTAEGDWRPIPEYGPKKKRPKAS
jgi:hypothetical protein